MKLSDWLTDPLSNIYFFSSVFLHKLNVLSIDQQADSTKKTGINLCFCTYLEISSHSTNRMGLRRNCRLREAKEMKVHSTGFLEASPVE
jgi:5-formaminoimidazole-4-carboxamide-1-beta-D-ribofuranosyl 5'-monophosphate synthetase